MTRSALNPIVASTRSPLPIFVFIHSSLPEVSVRGEVYPPVHRSAAAIEFLTSYFYGTCINSSGVKGCERLPSCVFTALI